MLKSFQENKKTALIAYLVAGDPSFEQTELYVDALVENGVDILELGVPFTDAMADGPIIQVASERAARRDGSIQSVLALARKIRTRHPKLGLVLFTYFNPIFKMGIAQFSERAKQAGIDGILTVDLPPEEATEYCDALKKVGVGTIFLASPTTSPERIALIDQASTSFVYYVSRVGVTGVQKNLSSTLEEELTELRKKSKNPIAVGFGISSGVQAAQLAPFADAVVVGSAFVKLISENPDPITASLKIGKLAHELKSAIQNG